MGKRFLRKSLVLFLGLALSIMLLGSASAQLTNDERGIILLQYYALRLQAIEIDNDGWMFWGELEKAKWPDALKDSFNQYDKLKNEIQTLAITDDLKNTQQVMASFIDKTKGIYQTLYKLDDKQIKEKFKEHQKNVIHLSNAMNDAFKKYYSLSDESNLKITDKELGLISDGKDKKAFLRSIDLIKKGKCLWAKGVLMPLLKKYKNTPFEASILMRLIDCYQVKDSDLQPDRGLERYQKQTLSFLKKGQYSPILFDLFGRWRTVDQIENHGMSNMSEIPNDEYLKIQWKVAETITAYIDKNPKDGWAKQQLPVLMTLGNIERGGAYGNTNLNYTAQYFFPKDGEKESKKKDQK